MILEITLELLKHFQYYFSLTIGQALLRYNANDLFGAKAVDYYVYIKQIVLANDIVPFMYHF